MNIQSHFIKTWITEMGDVNLFYENETPQFYLKTPYKEQKIDLNYIKEMPYEALSINKSSIESISRLFEKIYPKVIELNKKTSSLELIENCFDGMSVSVEISNQTISLRVNPNDTFNEVKEKIRQKAKISSENEITLLYKNENVKDSAMLVSYGINEGSRLISKVEKTEYTEYIEKAIYHNEDTRINLFDLFNHPINPHFASHIQKQAESVACMIEERDLLQDPQTKRYRFSNKPQTLSQNVEILKGYFPFGEEEKFRDEPVPAFWSGFLIEKKTLLTAAHCVCKGKSDNLHEWNKIASMRIVFGFQMIDKKKCKEFFEERDVYQIKRVIHHSWSRGKTFTDWALLELDREVVGRDPLKLDFSKIESGNVYMIGHPSGLPMKFAGGARITKAAHSQVMESDLCAFTGNSGSPVFRTDTKQVVGILVAGNSDYTVDFDYKGTGVAKSRVNYITSVSKGAEICQRISILDHVKKHVNEAFSLFKELNGLNFPGECSSIGCSTYGMRSFIHKGFGTFDLGKEFFESICKYCEKTPETIHSIVLNNCYFKYTGIDQNKKKIEKENSTANLIHLNLSNWKFFKIEVKNLNN